MKAICLADDSPAVVHGIAIFSHSVIRKPDPFSDASFILSKICIFRNFSRFFPRIFENGRILGIEIHLKTNRNDETNDGMMKTFQYRSLRRRD